MNVSSRMRRSMDGKLDSNLILEEDYQESYEPTEEG